MQSWLVRYRGEAMLTGKDRYSFTEDDQLLE